MNKFNIGDKVWFKLDSYGKKAERYGTICNCILCDPMSGWQYDIKTGDHKHWNIPEKDINYTAPHTREESDSLANSIKRKLDLINRNAVYGLKGGYDYPIGAHVRYRVDQEGLLKTDRTKIRTGYIKEICFKIKDNHKYYRITDDMFPYNATWAVEPEWILGYEPVDKPLKDFLNDIYGINNKEDNKMQQKKRNRNLINVKEHSRSIKEIMFNGPATIIKWDQSMAQFFDNQKGDKTVVVCGKGDKYDKTTGFLLAVLKEFVDNQSYDNILRKIDNIGNMNEWNVIPKVEKEKIFDELDKEADKINNMELDYKFQVGDIVRLKRGNALFKITKQTYWVLSTGSTVNRYRLQRLGKSGYTTYETERRLELVKRKGDK